MAAGDALSHGAVSSISMYDRINTLKFNASRFREPCLSLRERACVRARLSERGEGEETRRSGEHNGERSCTRVSFKLPFNIETLNEKLLCKKGC